MEVRYSVPGKGPVPAATLRLWRVNRRYSPLGEFVLAQGPLQDVNELLAELRRGPLDVRAVPVVRGSGVMTSSVLDLPEGEAVVATLRTGEAELTSPAMLP